MGQQHMVDRAHFVEREIAHAGTGIDQQVIVEQEGRGAAIPGNGPGASKHTHFHRIRPYFVSKLVVPSQPGSAGSRRNAATRSVYSCSRCFLAGYCRNSCRMSSHAAQSCAR